ncbi:hypothetical protein F4861DRAFT_530974 [Xylaria intraflava]|nr:hypothetical protein F4861DRAFT_530974 [Xylaria intraflava]
MLKGAATPPLSDLGADLKLREKARLTPDPAGKKTSPNHQRHQRQQSAPNLSTRRPNTPSLASPRQHNRRQSQGMGLTGDGRSRRASPVRPTGQPSRPSTPSAESNATAPPSHQTRTPLDTTPKSATQSRFGFLASSVSALTSRMASPTQAPNRSDDDLYDLDIEAALSPLPPPLGSDAFSPAAYKNLQMNATGLLHRMQDAYRRQAATLREMRAENEAQREEVEDMGLRSLNFKSQLERMAATAEQQEEAMQRLVAELRAERRARHEERVGREREKMFRVAEEGSVVGHEDLCVDEDERKRWRTSNSTVKSEISVDTDGDDSAESESIFSRSRSPTAMTCATESDGVDVPSASGLHLRVSMLMPKPKPAPPLTTFQRLVKGMSATKEEGGGPGSGASACRNCQGQDASVAWNTVSLLRDENIALKQRVAQLEVAIEGALDVVNGIKG